MSSSMLFRLKPRADERGWAHFGGKISPSEDEGRDGSVCAKVEAALVARSESVAWDAGCGN
jgi:hypothetical protein